MMRAWEVISPKRKARALRFRRMEAKVNQTLTGLLEREAFLRETGREIDELTIEENESGRPYVTGLDIPLYYNISHAGELMLCAVSEANVGIDVEEDKRYNERVVKRFFTEEETAFIDSYSEGERPTAFAKLWTMKEAFMKYTGLGFHFPVTQVGTRLTDEEFGEILPGDEVSEDLWEALKKQGIQRETLPKCRLYHPKCGYHGAVCAADLSDIRWIDVTADLASVWNED